jgi:hypothetical protein
MFATSHPKEVNRKFDTEQECGDQNSDRYREPVHDSRGPVGAATRG